MFATRYPVLALLMCAHGEAEYLLSSKTTLTGNFTQILLNSESSGLV